MNLGEGVSEQPCVQAMTKFGSSARFTVRSGSKIHSEKILTLKKILGWVPLTVNLARPRVT